VSKIIRPLRAYSIYPFFILTLLGFALGIGNTHAQKHPEDFKTASEFIKVVKYYRYLDPDSAILFVKAGLKKTLRDKDQLGYADLLQQYGMILDNAARYRESRQSYLEAEAIYRKNHSQQGLASTLVRLGVVEKRKANYDKSFAYFMDALALSTKNGDKLGILEARVVISETISV
jgi:tetratricopeptide (TPR) repeat protein